MLQSACDFAAGYALFVVDDNNSSDLATGCSPSM